MTLPVFHDPQLRAVTGAELRLDGPEGRHAAVVRRIGAGEQVQITDGRGIVAICTVLAADKAGLDARVEGVVSHERPSPRITVVQAIAKGERSELAVEMLTEIGVDRIVPWAASRSVAIWRGDRAGRSLAKWRGTAVEAGKQSRRSWFPEVAEQHTTAQVAELIAGASTAAVLHEAATQPVADLAPTDDLVLVVGPEGGVSPEEIAAFAAAGAAVVRLGPTVLRTSTAGVAAVSAVLAHSARWA